MVNKCRLITLKMTSFLLRLLFLSVLLFFATSSSFAQETFKIHTASPKYDLVVQTQARDPKRYYNEFDDGYPARLSFFKKGAKSPFQVLRMPNVVIFKDMLAYNPNISKKSRGLYDDEYSVIFDDFNFDGQEDVAICNGRGGGYGMPSYDVYLFNKNTGKFSKNKWLTRLAEGGYLGLFFVDPKKRRLTAFSKSGCCYHEIEEYEVVQDRPVLVEKTIDDATGSKRVITTRKRINGKWVTKVRKEKLPKPDK